MLLVTMSLALVAKCQLCLQGYLTADLFEKAKNLKLCVTAGVGSDHIDLDAAVKHDVQVRPMSIGVIRED